MSGSVAGAGTGALPGRAAPAPATRATRRALWLTGAGALLLGLVIALLLAPLEPGALALQFAATPRVFGTIIHVWSPEHLQRYRMHLPADALLLACYGTFGWLLVMRTTLFGGAPRALRLAVALLAPLAAGADATEDLLHAWLTEAPRFGVAPLYAFSTACSAAKWLLLFAFALAVLAALAWRDDE